jgi:hypothetical protein
MELDRTSTLKGNVKNLLIREKTYLSMYFLCCWAKQNFMEIPVTRENSGVERKHLNYQEFERNPYNSGV